MRRKSNHERNLFRAASGGRELEAQRKTNLESSRPATGNNVISMEIYPAPFIGTLRWREEDLFSGRDSAEDTLQNEKNTR